MTTVARCLFTEPNNYGAGFEEDEAELIVTGIGGFRASYDRIDTGRLRIVVGEEEVARVAYVKLRADAGLLTFPMAKGSTLIMSGEVVRFGEFVWHGPGGRLHERISRHTKWGRIRLNPATLWENMRRSTHPGPVAAASGHVIVPDLIHREMLLAAVKDAVALAKSNPDDAPAAEGGRSIERTLLKSLVGLLAAPNRTPANRASERHHEIMLRLEDLLQPRLQQAFQLPSIAAALQISERTLRTCCEEHLGIGLHRYLRLRRLKLARHHLSQSDPGATSVAAVARRYGFLDLGRFAATYYGAFGELPSATLARLRQSPVPDAQQYRTGRPARIDASKERIDASKE